MWSTAWLCISKWFYHRTHSSASSQNNKETSGKEDTCFYLPYCFVFKDTGTTKCTPAVFPGSVNSPTRISKNDNSTQGPPLIFSPIKFSANIKRHQQIMIHPKSSAVLTSWSNPTVPAHCGYHCLQNSFSALQARRCLKKPSDNSKQLQPRL